MLYIFSKDEKLVAILKPDFGRTTIKTGVSQAFLHTEYPAAFDRAEVEGCPYFDAVHTEKLTGENIFTFSVPANHQDAQYVTEGNLVAFKDLDGNWQLFEIKRVTDTHDDDLIRTAFCEHVFYELIDDFIEDKRPYNTTAAYALQRALEGTRWQVGVVDDLGLNSVNFYYESVLSAIQKVANTWGGELQFRIAVVGNTIAARYVDLLSRRGAETGKQFVYSKDIKSIEREVDLTQVVTALYGRGKGEQIEEGYGRRITFEDVEWSVANGDPADKPLGQKWVGDPEALARWGRPGGRHRFGVFEDSEEEDPAVLLQKTWEELQKRKNPRITYKLDVADLERLTGYEHEKVRLGDTVRVIDRAFSPELLVEARVIEIQRDLLQPESTKITLGNFAPSLADEALRQEQIRQIIADRQGIWDRANQFNPDGTLNTSWLEGIIDTLQNEVRAGKGTVKVTDNNGILIVDDPDNPTKVLRLLGGMFAIANSKDPVTGEWNWRTFGTGDGFTADLINAGKIRAQFIQVGSGTDFEEGYDPSTKETPEGAQAKADAAEANAKTYAAQQASAAQSAAEDYADTIMQQLANGSYTGGTFINGKSIISPVIAGLEGVFSGKVRVGTDGPIIIDGINKRITIDANNYIDATGIHVSAANIMGLITGGQIAAKTLTAREINIELTDENLLPDSSFEFMQWHKKDGPANITYEMGKNWLFPCSGDYMLGIGTTGTDCYCTLQYSPDGTYFYGIPVDDEVGEYTLSFYYSIVSFAYGVSAVNNLCRVRFFQIDTELGSVEIPIDLGTFNIVDPASGWAEWRRASVTFTVPQHCTTIFIQLGVQFNQGSSRNYFLVDNMMLTKGGLLHTYKPATTELMIRRWNDVDDIRRIAYDGIDKLGIGKTWERGALDVAGDVYVNGCIGIGTSLAPGEKFAVSDGTTKFGIFPGYLDNVPNPNWVTIDIPDYKNLRIWDHLSIWGNVGIGTTSPSAKLEVIGNVKATAFIQSSSIKNKTDVTLLDSPQAYEKIKALKIYKYTRTEEGIEGQKQLGVIAEEAPEEILSRDKTGIDLYSYVSLVAKAVQELQTRFEKIEQQLRIERRIVQ